ncbi:hypothetical protein [Shimia sp.]|uniref:hypothetical protein n=1 Tax=Shimia sp. TaxID=1954381 RepID=UPI00356660BD
MKTESILAQIWGQMLELRPAGEGSPLTEVLGALLKVPVVALVSDSEVFEPVAMKECDDLLPGATLGDVLHEELGLFIEPGAVVVLEPRNGRGAAMVSGHDLGRSLGRILVDLAESELRALKKESRPRVSAAHHRLSHRLTARPVTPEGFGLEAGPFAESRAVPTVN